MPVKADGRTCPGTGELPKSHNEIQSAPFVEFGIAPREPPLGLVVQQDDADERGESMRDIRGDLGERANLLERQINSAQAHFETLVEQFKTEHESRLKNVKAELEAVRVLMGVEDRRHGNGASAPKAQSPAQQPQPKLEQAQPVQPAQAQSPQPAPKPSQPQRPQQQLGDFLIRRLREGGAMPKDDLRRLAVQEGYFADDHSADSDLQATLVHIVKAGFIRELPNGKFAPPTLLDTIRLRRAI